MILATLPAAPAVPFFGSVGLPEEVPTQAEPAGPASTHTPETDCELPDSPPARDEGGCAPSPASPEPGVRFIPTGDTGTGGRAQARVAETMESVCWSSGCDFVVVAGDNVYETGVDDVRDPQFETKFQEPNADLEDLGEVLARTGVDQQASEARLSGLEPRPS